MGNSWWMPYHDNRVPTRILRNSCESRDLFYQWHFVVDSQRGPLKNGDLVKIHFQEWPHRLLALPNVPRFFWMLRIDTCALLSATPFLGHHLPLKPTLEKIKATKGFTSMT